MLNLDGIANKNNKDHNKKWRYIPYRPCRIWIIGGSGLGKTNALLSLMIQQDDIDKNLFVYKGFKWTKYQFLIGKCGNAWNKTFKRFKSIYLVFKCYG